MSGDFVVIFLISKQLMFAATSCCLISLMFDSGRPERTNLRVLSSGMSCVKNVFFCATRYCLTVLKSLVFVSVIFVPMVINLTK